MNPDYKETRNTSRVWRIDDYTRMILNESSAGSSLEIRVGLKGEWRTVLEKATEVLEDVSDDYKYPTDPDDISTVQGMIQYDRETSKVLHKDLLDQVEDFLSLFPTPHVTKTTYGARVCDYYSSYVGTITHWFPEDYNLKMEELQQFTDRFIDWFTNNKPEQYREETR